MTKKVRQRRSPKAKKANRKARQHRIAARRRSVRQRSRRSAE